MNVHPDYEEFVASLNAHQVKYLIVGAHALGFHGVPRYTKDLDFWIELTRKNIQHFLKALQSFFNTDFGLSLADFNPRAVLQFGVAPIRIDVLTSVAGLSFKTAWRDRLRSKYGSKPSNYLSLNALIRAKRAAGREQDVIDLKKLLQIKKRR